MVLPANAASKTLHFYSVQQTSSLLDSSGNPVSAVEPAVGEVVDITDLDYAGTYKHHGKNWVGSDHLHCTVTAASAIMATGLCNAQFAVMGSLLLANDVIISFTQSGISAVPLNEGTGRFRGLRGTITDTSVANSSNANVTIKLSS